VSIVDEWTALLGRLGDTSIGVNPRAVTPVATCVPVSLLPVTNDVKLNISDGEQLTVARLRQFLSSADRFGLPDNTIVICTAIVATGSIASLMTQISRTVPDADAHVEEA
jgi:hypothetical protein